MNTGSWEARFPRPIFSNGVDSTKNEICYRLWGRRALFSDPVTRVGGEKSSYPVPTYEALKGVTESIYWKPTITWVIDDVRVLNPIRNESVNVKPISYGGGPNTLSIYTYLHDVEYQIRAHFEWNSVRSDLEADRNENKHYFQAVRALEKGGRRDIFLGTRECQGYVEPCIFGDGPGSYDGSGSVPLGIMVHGIDYADETGRNEMAVRLWMPTMDDGVIHFLRPEQCTIRKHIRDYKPRAIKVSEESE